MKNFEQNPGFLQERYPGLAKSPEVRQVAKRIKQRTGKTPVKITAEKASGDESVDSQLADIQNYLNHFKEIINRLSEKDKTRGINALKRILINRYVIRVEDIPESYWQVQMRIIRERGMAGDWQDLPEEEKQKIKQEHLAC